MVRGESPRWSAWITALSLLIAWPEWAFAASMGPPMLDISRQCDASSRHNATAMSECVVAESEARAELLQKWDKVTDASAEKCVKLGRKARKLPYTTIAKCVAAEPPVPRAPSAGAK